MNPLTLEWIQKAEGDYHTSLREVRSRMHPNYDAACFHAQQCIEKYLKACLQENRVDIPRVHKLVDLMVLCMQFDPAFLLIEPDVKVLSGYEVRFRYPGLFASKQEAKDATQVMKAVRKFIRERLEFS